MQRRVLKTMPHKIRKILLLLLPILLIISVPWYRDTDANTDASQQSGMPDWALIAILCYLALSIISASIWLFFPPESSRDDI
ncbi:hypothetical protein [Endozoicomonas ascidiicola]|uniref:hypothetical protein n=2 Tax=Endozoicomonas ascidiicola TaxID=1698521 RepID=UPI0012FC676E|nr:hypothetical protein [Endozoicomonas ascidiicola]